MKLCLSSAVALLSPLLAYTLELPFELPTNLQSPLDSLKHNLESLRALRPKLEMPAFIKQYTDPIGASPLLSLHRDLVRIESVTGNENAVGMWLVEYLTKLNYTVEMQPVVGGQTKVKGVGMASAATGRFNVLAYIGKSKTTRALLSSHIDVVPPYWPYEVRGQKISGRGSVDAKGCVAAQIQAVEELRGSGEIREGDVALLFVVGEETGGDGMRAANKLGLSWETVIFGEPTELKLATGHKGILLFTLSAQGKASHSGYPELGINANSLLLPVLLALDRLALPASERLGNSTLNIGRIEGGVAANVIPAQAYAQGSVRIAATTPEEVKDIMLLAVDKTGVEGVKLEFGDGCYGPVHLDSDIEGFETTPVSYGTDVPRLLGTHKRYLYGPGSILVAHSDHESLTIQDLQDAVVGYKKLVKSALKGRGLIIAVEQAQPPEPEKSPEHQAPPDDAAGSGAFDANTDTVVEGKVLG
ncbi:MAG: hypothetical protein M1839_000427 [Geoglossum umbratile]|nr:MAG: hypothetical protein M1839_000427 [Geoglossum umbratile]